MKERCGNNIHINKVWLILAGIMAIVLLFVVELPVEAAGQEVVYTSAWDNNDSHSGNGTKGSPYNQFADAVANVKDGGTIYILSSKSAMIHEQTNNGPFVIDKKVTVEPEPGATSATLTSRAAGIVLGADVTFKNIELNVINGYHDQIFANGYGLSLINVTRGNGSRLVDLVAGGLYYNRGNPVVGTTPGTHGKITVQGKTCKFGNIYAGSIEGDFYGSVSINIQDINSTSIGDIYAYGAHEAVFDGGDLFGEQEPLAPEADEMYTVFGEVDVTLDNAPVKKIEGACADGIELNVYTENQLDNCSYANINQLTVGKGALQPQKLTAPKAGMNLSVLSEGTLDLTKIGDISVNNFSGGGTLVLEPNSLMTITGQVTGSTALAVTRKNYDGSSGMAVEDHVYIRTTPKSEGIFTFSPYYTQTHLQLQKQSDGGWKIVKPVGGVTVTITYTSEDLAKGDVDSDGDTIDSVNGKPWGATAEANPGYHFVNWTRDGVEVGKEERFVPEKKDGVYESANYIAHFAKDPEPGETKPPVIDPEEPDPEQPEPEQPDPEEPNPDQPSPEKPDQPGPKPESTKPSVSKPTVTTPPVSPSKPATPSVTKPEPVKVSLSRPKVKLKAGKKSAVVKYNKVKNASGYEIYRSTKKKSGYKKVAVTKKTSYKDKKLTRKKKYYYKVRAYRKVDGKKIYSSYSAVKAVKAK